MAGQFRRAMAAKPHSSGVELCPSGKVIAFTMHHSNWSETK
jgi:hypothetical protein